MKRIIIFCLVAILLCTTVTAGCWCPGHLDGSQPYIPGDLDKDSVIGARDALYLLQIFVSKLPMSIPLFSSGKACADIYVMDVNNDQKIGADDALDILKFSVGKIDGFARQPYYPETASPDTATPDTPTDI